MEQIGKQINVPGSYWEGRQSAEERSIKYKCTVRDFTLSYKFPTRPAPAAAFQLLATAPPCPQPDRHCRGAPAQATASA